MGTKRQKIVEGMQEKDKERRKKQPKRKYHGIKGKTVPGQKSWHHPLPEGYKEGSTKGKKSIVGGGKQAVKTVTPEHLKTPKKKAAAPPAKKAAAEKKVKKTGEGMGYIKEAAKRTKGTKPAPHMVRHTKAPAKAKAAASFTEKAGVAQDIGPWKPTDRKATKPKVSYKKPKKTPFGMKKGGSVKKKSKSSVGGGKQGVKTVTPEHMKAPPAKRTKGTKAAPHMVKHSMGSLTGITTAEDWSKMRKMDAELDREWEKAVPSSYQGKGHGRKVVHGNKGAHRRRAAEEHMWDESMGKALKKKSKSSKRRLPKVPQRKGRTAADTQWGGYDFKDGGRIPGIRPTRKGT